MKNLVLFIILLGFFIVSCTNKTTISKEIDYDSVEVTQTIDTSKTSVQKLTPAATSSSTPKLNNISVFVFHDLLDSSYKCNIT